MKVHFQQPAFEAQLLRTVSYTINGCADLGECLTTAGKIKEGDFESWHSEWFRTAEWLFEIGKQSEQEGHTVSARETYLRASNYYRASMAFLYRSPVKEKAIEALEKHTLTFSRAAKLFKTPFAPVSIPFDKNILPGYYYKSSVGRDTRPLIITHSGYDGTHQECFFSFIPSALKRGYDVIAFDGPGQGHLLFKQGIPMRADWYRVVGAVIDFCSENFSFDKERIVLYGPSWGGLLAPLAATQEKRIAALIANPGQFDPMETLKRIAEGKSDENDGPPPSIESFLSAAMSDRFFDAKIKAKMFVHGVDTPAELFNTWKDYSLRGLCSKIQCPTLVCDSENEPLSTGQAKLLFDSLQCDKDYQLFTRSEGAGEHCCAGALALMSQRVFDWLDRKLNVGKTANESQEAIVLGYQQ